MLNCFVSTLLFAGFISADVTQLNGDKFVGELVDWQGSTITLNVDNESRTISTEQLLSITFDDHKPLKTAATTRVTLTCGSSFLATNLSTKNARVAAQLAHGGSIEFDQPVLRSVRFNSPSDRLDSQWFDLIGQQHEGDIIVIRKSAESLDYLEGVISHVTNEHLTFTMDGDDIEVPLRKLEGFAPYHKGSENLFASQCQIKTHSDDIWNVDALFLAGKHFHVETPSGVALDLPRDTVRQVGFAASNVVYLSDLEPTRVKMVPLVTGDESPSSVTELLYAPRWDESFDGTPLMLREANGGTTSFAKGLAIHSRSELLYRLDSQHRKLRGIVGIDPSVRSAATVTLQVFGNEQQLLDEQVVAGAAPLTIDVDITGVRRLKIVVDYGDGVDLGDRLHLCNLRTTK